MRTLNLGIVAHVDAGKTSLTERLLHAAGVIDAIGSVDDGTTQTDSLALERQRGITIRAAVASFTLGDVPGQTAVNLIDTPGHPDFIAEVERVLSVLDGAILVVSAVEGVQPQTRILMRALRRLRIPTLIFVNKTDRRGADPENVITGISQKLTSAVVSSDNPAEVLAEHDDALLAAYVDGTTITPDRLRRELATQTAKALVHPVFRGSAITGAGIEDLITGITELLPAAPDEVDGPVSGTVFKVERGPAGEKIAYVRLFSGTVRVRDRLPCGRKVTAISVFDSSAVPHQISAGQIGRLWGLSDIKIGDCIGAANTVARPQFAPPTLETVVVPRRRGRHLGALYSALSQLAEQDPLINLRQDDVRQEISLSLYGEVQKEVIQATLATDFGIEVGFRETTAICVERPAGTGAAAELIGKEPNPFLATVGLRVEPAPVGSGVRFELEVELGSMPYAFIKAVDETVTETLRQGIHGWEVTDCVVVMTHSGYYARQSHSHGTFDKSMSSTAGDFRNLTPLVLMDALSRAGTVVHEPMHRFRLELPADLTGAVLPELARLRAVPNAPEPGLLDGVIPAARVHELEQVLPSLTRGEGVLEFEFDHYRPVTGAVPARPRTDHDPLNRKDYLIRVQRRVGM
ncbi:MAG: translation factor GTPase family protein [Kibdelosporangium sp.]